MSSYIYFLAQIKVKRARVIRNAVVMLVLQPKVNSLSLALLSPSVVKEEVESTI